MTSAPSTERINELFQLRQRNAHAILSPICSSVIDRISIRHPAYESSRLIELCAFDASGGGLHYRTALLICGIIAGNIWNGWFTDKRHGQRLHMDEESLLKGREYFFHVPWPDEESQEARLSGAYKYPVVPSFQHWAFPHNNPPPGWTFQTDLTADVNSLFPVPSVSSVSQAVRDRDKSCRLTAYHDGIVRAHLTPRSEVEWFIQQEMDRYNISRSLVGKALVDDTSNALALRHDVHIFFDAGGFIFTRKLGEWVPHFLIPSYNLGPEYHNTCTDLPASVHPAFLLARIAWAVLPSVQNFLLRGERRLVSLRQAVDNPAASKELQLDDLTRLVGVTKRGRGESPKKRQRQEDMTGVLAAEAVGVKRARLEITKPTDSTTKLPHSPSLSTPNSPSICSNSLLSFTRRNSSRQCEPAVEVHEDTEDDRFAALRRTALKAQRPSNPELYCCDYDSAERADAKGLQGPQKFGGAHLCMQCLGVEYRDEDGKDFPTIPEIWNSEPEVLKVEKDWPSP